MANKPLQLIIKQESLYNLSLILFSDQFIEKLIKLLDDIFKLNILSIAMESKIIKWMLFKAFF